MGSWLRITSGPGEGQRLDVEADLEVGREVDALGKLGEDDQLSRSHARFSRTPDGQIVVEDLGSTNGTFVNGTRVTGPVTLRVGDRVAMGRSELEVVDQDRTAIRTSPLPPEATAPQPTTARPTPTPAAASGPPPLGPLPSKLGATAEQGPKGTNTDLRVPILGLLLLFAVAGLVVLFLTRDDDDEASTASTAAATSDGAFDGTIYVLSNRLAPRGNAVLAFRYGDGSLYPLRMREYPTGGTGGDAHDNNLALDGDQQVWTNEDRTLLFAVNMGSDSIAVFRIADDGTLTAVPGSPFPSGGTGPISVGVSDGTAVVVNKGFDGVRRANERPVITQFRIADDGRLSPIGEPIQLEAGSNPTQAQVAADGRLIFVSELVGQKFNALVRQDDGSYVAGPVTPITDRERRFGQPPGGPPGGGGGGGPPEDGGGGPPGGGGGGPPEDVALPMGIEGLVVHPREPIIYSEVPTFSEVMAHSFEDSGELSFESGQFVPDGLLVCWAEISSDGRFLFITATATNRVVVFDLENPRRPRRIQTLELEAGPSGPINLRLDETGSTLFVLSSGGSDEMPGTHRQIHTLDVGSDGRLEETEEPLELPVPVPRAGPMGLVVVPRR